jgi:glucosamine 6-phosphate synthetase-like amidotransferase/phosphosugar isomerase protein
MCGITGYLRTGDCTVSVKSALRETMKGIAVRGRHASGFAALKGDEIFAYKHHVPSTVLVKSHEWKKHSKAPDILIGHSRYATHGDPKNNDNNHPHWTEDMRYVMVHNGVVSDPVPEVETVSECDSEKLLRLIEKHGVVEGFRRIGQLPASRYAVMLIDHHEGALYIYRNTSPCYFLDLSFELGGLLFASTDDILIQSLKSAGLGIRAIRKRMTEILPGMLYKFTPGSNKPKVKDLPLAEPAESGVLNWRSY